MYQKFILFNGEQKECNEKTTFNELFESLQTREGSYGDYFWKIKGDLDNLPDKPKKNQKLGSLQGFKQNGKMLEINCTIMRLSSSPIKQKRESEETTQDNSQRISKYQAVQNLRPVQNQYIPQPLIPPPTEQIDSIFQLNPIKPKIVQQDPKVTRKFQKSPTTPPEVKKPLKDYEITIRDEGSIVEVSKLNGEFCYILKESDASEFEQLKAKQVYDSVQKQTDGSNLLSVAQKNDKNIQTKVFFCNDYRGLVVKWYSELYTIIFININ